MKPHDIIKRPIALTEKASRLREQNKVVFEVDRDANKLQIRDAVETLFSVKVTDVNTLVQRGKMKRMGRALAKRRNWKKAIVTLRPGDDIQFFDESKE
ncbi:MAG TPA: 50S ribosomal protein L23 [Polyangiaceae bacterium]|nr:50S ribosomal protein L23 [Polyangiaceae bacterium]